MWRNPYTIKSRQMGLSSYSYSYSYHLGRHGRTRTTVDIDIMSNHSILCENDAKANAKAITLATAAASLIRRTTALEWSCLYTLIMRMPHVVDYAIKSYFYLLLLTHQFTSKGCLEVVV